MPRSSSEFDTPATAIVQTSDLALLFELYENTQRQGPGSPDTTRRALDLLPDSLAPKRVLDLGCGSGGSTLVLAELPDAYITAVDIHPPFLATLRACASARGLSDRITTIAADMSKVEAFGSEFDLIWSEGSAYSIGFANALTIWRQLLRPAGCLVVTELVWFTAIPSEESKAFFESEYPDMRDESERIKDALDAGYKLVDSFRLPEADWHAYYDGLEAALSRGISRRGDHPIYKSTQREIEIHESYGGEYGYTCLIMQRA